MGEAPITRPAFESWQKVKELRLEHYREIANAREEGKLVVVGYGEFPAPLLAGLGPHVYMHGEPCAASCAHSREFSVQCLREAENRGYGRDICAYARNFLGSMYLDRYAFGGPFPAPDLIVTNPLGCTAHAKWWQAVADLPCPLRDHGLGAAQFHKGQRRTVRSYVRHG